MKIFARRATFEKMPQANSKIVYWVWFFFCLVENVAEVFLSQSLTANSIKARPVSHTFDNQVKTSQYGHLP